MIDLRLDSLDAYTSAPTQALIRPEAPRPPSRLERAGQLAAGAAVRPRNLRGLGVALALALAAWLAGAPWLAPWILGLGTLHYAGAVTASALGSVRVERARGPLALPLAPEVEPAEIAAADLRSTYHDILRHHEDIRCALVEAERVQASLRAVFERCGAVVHVAGRLARLANPLQRYLELHAASQVTKELHRLSATAETASDPLARDVYHTAAAARGRQLGTLLEIQNLRDRIRARLELISASLESVAALVIKLQVLDLEQVTLAGETMTEQLDSLHEELAVLETTIDEL